MHASLWGGDHLLKAPGREEHYLADGIFYSTNDNVGVYGNHIKTRDLPLLLPDGSHYSYLQIEGTSLGYVNAKFGQAEYGGPRLAPSYWASGGCSVAACGQSPQGV